MTTQNSLCVLCGEYVTAIPARGTSRVEARPDARSDESDFSASQESRLSERAAAARCHREPQFTRSKRTPRVRPLDMYKPITRPSRSRSNDTSSPPPANVSTAPGLRLRSSILRC